MTEEIASPGQRDGKNNKNYAVSGSFVRGEMNGTVRSFVIPGLSVFLVPKVIHSSIYAASVDLSRSRVVLTGPLKTELSIAAVENVRSRDIRGCVQSSSSSRTGEEVRTLTQCS